MPPLESSTEETVEQSTQNTQDVTTAASSSADDKGEKSPASMLDAVKAAAAKPVEGSPASEGSQEEDKGASPEQASAEGQAEGEDTDELNDEDVRRFNQRNRRRVQKLLDQRRELRVRIDEYAPKVEAFDRIVKFQEEAGLSTDEVSNGFEIMRLIKHDPEQAYEALMPYMQKLAVVIGKILPPDLQKQVQDGFITEAAAREISQGRARQALHRETTRQQQTQETQRQQTEQQQQAISTMANAVTAREKQWLSSDPDYSVKQQLVNQRLELKLRQGRIPRTPEEATALADECKAEVDKEVRRFRPARIEQRPVAGSASQSAAPKPNSLLEAMKQAAGGR